MLLLLFRFVTSSSDNQILLVIGKLPYEEMCICNLEELTNLQKWLHKDAFTCILKWLNHLYDKSFFLFLSIFGLNLEKLSGLIKIAFPSSFEIIFWSIFFLDISRMFLFFIILSFFLYFVKDNLNHQKEHRELLISSTSQVNSYRLFILFSPIFLLP